VQAIAISFAIAPLPVLLGGWVDWLNTVLMAAALALTVWSGALYVRDALVIARDRRRA
jgi:CDP-diacylglycerol--glycerol-3-phosphate 3-phosphatidyltransferase